MKYIWSIVKKVVKAYSLEEKVISAVVLLLLTFFMVRSVFFLASPQSAFADNSVYTEAEVSNKPILINPLYTDFSQANRDLSTLVFSGLLKYDPMMRGFVDDLASLKISENRQEYLFTIRDNALWHDGKPVTADDVIFTYGLIQDENFQNPLLKANFQGVRIEKVDEKSVKFILSSQNSFFITNLNVGILPKHLLGEVPVGELMNNKFNLQPVGSGPYKVSSPVETENNGKQRVTLDKFADFYAVKPKISQVRFKIYPDEDSLLRDKASINVVSRISGKLSELVYDSRFKTESYLLPQYSAVFFNTESSALKEQKVRIALIKLVDKDELIKKLDNKIRIDTPLLELDQKQWLNKPGLAEANGALFDSGYKYKKDDKGNVLPGEIYRRDKDGKELLMTLMVRQYEDGSAQAVEEQNTTDFLVDAWKKGGIKVEIKILPEQDYLEAIRTKKYDMILAGQSMGYNLDTFPFWHSSQIKEDGLNLSNFRNLAADSQIEKIRATFDKDEKEDRQKKLADIISKEAPALFLYRPSYLFLTDGKLKNFKLENLSYISDRFVNIADWCIGNECK
jgi:peptide/nickel transport system substrate-binding protein